MLVLLNGGRGYTFDHKCKGQKVIAKKLSDNCVVVRLSELVRVGILDREAACTTNRLSDTYAFVNDSYYQHYEVVEPKLQNCTDLSVGKGWEGYYDQKPIKKSNFR